MPIKKITDFQKQLTGPNILLSAAPGSDSQKDLMPEMSVHYNEMKPGEEVRPHTHNRVEVYLFLTGRAKVMTGDEIEEVTTGDVAIAPIGIINAGNPAQAYQDGFNIAFINQDNVNRDTAASVAAGVAAAFLPDVTVDSVLKTMTEYSSDLLRRGIILTMDLAYDSSSVDEFTEKFYDKMLDWTWPSRGWKKDRFFSGNSLEFVPAAMALLYLCKGDVEESIVEGASFGRDCDTIASVIGNIVGAMHGASVIRRDWIETTEEANADFFEELEGDKDANFYSMAYRMVEAIKSERQTTQERLKMLDEILDTCKNNPLRS